MKTLSNPRDRNELLVRFTKLRADSQPRWGAMSAHQMICHLSDSFRGSLGEKYVSPATSLFKRTLMKWVALGGAWHRVKRQTSSDAEEVETVAHLEITFESSYMSAESTGMVASTYHRSGWPIRLGIFVHNG